MFFLSLSKGNANDSFSSNNHAQFSTIDKDDTICTKTFGAWWFLNSSGNCGYSNLNGNYSQTGMRWANWEEDPNTHIIKSEMKIKPDCPEE